MLPRLCFTQANTRGNSSLPFYRVLRLTTSIWNSHTQSISSGHLIQAPFLETRISIQNSLQKSLKIPTYFLPNISTPSLHHHTTASHTPQNGVFGPLHPLLLRPALGPASVQRRPVRRRRRHLPGRQVLLRVLRDSRNRPVLTERGRRAEHRRCGPGGEGSGDESRGDLCGAGK